MTSEPGGRAWRETKMDQRHLDQSTLVSHSQPALEGRWRELALWWPPDRRAKT